MIKHIAIIPDGNRRWATNQNLPVNKGHEAGFEALRKILKECKDSGPTVLSFYAFSTENFRRSELEVNNLFGLLERVLDKFSKELLENGIQLRISGTSNNLSKNLIAKLEKAQKLCSEGDFILNICFNYGAQEDIIQATKKIAEEYKNDKISLDDINDFQKYLWNGDLPPVDLMIRTSGEQRISNFLLWQCAYAEFAFSDKLWPDFSPEDLLQALEDFRSRKRRYGA
ncbi:MAG: polyprenyl diphosphate synthase [Brevinema sp.]